MSATAPSTPTGIYDTIEAGEKIVVIDLFCGAGGMSSGAVRVLEKIAADVGKPVEEIADVIAVNHWDCAIETHQANYPWATHYHTPIQELRPRDLETDEKSPLDEDGTVHLLIACPDCTYFSSARGGGPKDPDSRATPREILDFVERLDVRNLLFENVPEFENWGPLDENNEPIEEKAGEYFENWVNALTIEGFAVEWRKLNAADYGDATSRRRLFVCGRKDSGVDWPEQTHSENGERPGTEPWRTAADIIDWSDLGESIWTRDLHDGRRTPLASNTMQRIAEGIRRHGHPDLVPFADALEQFGNQKDIEKGKDVTVLDALRERVVPVEDAATAAEALTEPFLVKYYGTSSTRPMDEPLDTVTSGGQKFALCTPYILGQRSTGAPRPVTDRPVPTITTTSRGISFCNPEAFVLGQQSGARPRVVTETPLNTISTKGAISKVDPRTFVLPKNGLQRDIFSNASYPTSERPMHTIVSGRTDQGYTVTPYLVPFYGERENQRPRTHAVDAPLPTVPASAIKRAAAKPYLVEYYGNGRAQPVDRPIPTIPTRDRFALVVPEFYPLGIDVLFRMLKPSELAAAMGFDGYEFRGNKSETVKQIGNAVPVNVSEALCEGLLLGSSPTLDSYTDSGHLEVEADD